MLTLKKKRKKQNQKQTVGTFQQIYKKYLQSDTCNQRV